MTKQQPQKKDRKHDWGFDFVPSEQNTKTCPELLLMADHNCPFYGICPTCGLNGGDDCSGDNL